MRPRDRQASPVPSGALGASRCRPWPVRLFVERSIPRDGPVMTIEPSHALASYRPHARAQLWIAGELHHRHRGFHRRGEVSDDAARSELTIELAPPVDELAARPDVGGDHRKSCGARFQNHERLSLTEAREHDDIELRINALDRLCALATDDVAEVQFRSQPAATRGIIAVLVFRSDNANAEIDPPRSNRARTEERDRVLDGD